MGLESYALAFVIPPFQIEGNTKNRLSNTTYIIPNTLHLITTHYRIYDLIPKQHGRPRCIAEPNGTLWCSLSHGRLLYMVICQRRTSRQLILLIFVSFSVSFEFFEQETSSTLLCMPQMLIHIFAKHVGPSSPRGRCMHYDLQVVRTTTHEHTMHRAPPRCPA